MHLHIVSHHYLDSPHHRPHRQLFDVDETESRVIHFLLSPLRFVVILGNRVRAGAPKREYHRYIPPAI